MVSDTYQVVGMTCSHCVEAVTEELSGLDGVDEVMVQLVAGGTSTVTVTGVGSLRDEDVAAALDEAGNYKLAGSDT